jgi:hypothetical protein
MPRATKSRGATPQAPANAFIGQMQAPSRQEMETALGRPTMAVWDELLGGLADLGLDVSEWHSYSPKAG